MALVLESNSLRVFEHRADSCATAVHLYYVLRSSVQLSVYRLCIIGIETVTLKP